MLLLVLARQSLSQLFFIDCACGMRQVLVHVFRLFYVKGSNPFNSESITMSYSNPNNYPDFLNEKLKHFYIDKIEKEWGGQHIMRGKVTDQHSIELMSNDYLSIASHQDILVAQKDALSANESALLMSTVFLKENSPQIVFEKKMAEFLHADETVLCQSGYAANIGLIQSMIGDTNIPIYVDQFAHMSLWDGASMAEGSIIPFRHNSVSNLMTLIKQRGPGVVIVDSVYSTNGSVCPLVELVDTAFYLGCVLLVDESHSLGTHGPQGRGLVVEYGLEDKVMFRSASLAKAFASRAGIIACPEDVADLFKMTSKPSIFSSSLLPHEIMGLDKTLDVIANADIQRRRLKNNTQFLRDALDRLGYNVSTGEAQIIALESGSEYNTILLRDALEKRGIFGSVFCAPATPRNRAIIRFSVNASLTKSQLNKVVDACAEIVGELDVPHWRSSLRKRRPSYEYKQQA